MAAGQSEAVRTELENQRRTDKQGHLLDIRNPDRTCWSLDADGAPRHGCFSQSVSVSLLMLQTGTSLLT